MKKTILGIALAAASFAAAGSASAQTTPDGSRPFGIDPYVGVMGGYESFDRAPGHGIPARLPGQDRLDGGLVEGVVGVNVPLGSFFIGAEGDVAKGFVGDVDWKYGVAGRAGFRAGETALVYGKVGHEWVNFDRFGNDSPDFGATAYGIGAEVGPKFVGLDGLVKKEGVRVRLEVNTYDFDSVRPMIGLVGHF
jgi:outer membrane immunogenic protein